MENVPSELRPRLINAEPLLLFFSLGGGFYSSVYQVFILSKICLLAAPKILSPSESAHDFCADLISSSSKSNVSDNIRGEIEAAASKFMIYYQICVNAPTILIAFLVGAWSDSFGRKLPIAVASAGSTIAVFIMLSTAVFDSAPLYLLLLTAILKGFTGDILFVVSGAFAMISDSVRDPVKLTVRLGMASGAISLGYFLGSILSAVILSRWDNYSYILGGSMVFTAIAFFYTVFGASETLHLVKSSSAVVGSNPTDDQDSSDVLDDASDAIPIVQAKRLGFCQVCFSFERVKESMRTLFTKRPGKRRLYLLVALGSLFVAFSCDIGMPGILNYYVKLPPLSFTDSQYSYLAASITAGMTIGMMAFPWIAKRLLHTSDSAIVVVGLAIGMVKLVAVGFSTRPWMIFVVEAVGSISAAYLTGFRAFLSKLVHRDEAGRVFAAVAASEHIGPLISTVIFNNLFAYTLRWFPGFVYLMAGIAMGAVLVVMSWIHIDSRLQQLESEGVIDVKAETEDDHQAMIT